MSSCKAVLLPEDQSSVPSSTHKQLTTTCHCSTKGLDIPQDGLPTLNVHMPTESYGHTCRSISDKNIFFNIIKPKKKR